MDEVAWIPCPLRSAARRSPDAPAIAGSAVSLTYRELDHLVSASEVRIRDLGLGVGDRVALHFPRDERYFVLLLALMRAGCVACLLSTRLPARVGAPLPERIACRALISTSEEVLEAATMRTLRPADLLAGEAAAGRSRLCDEVWLALERPSTVVFTSGSAGAPKAALHTFGNHYWSALGSNANIPLGQGDRWLHSLPLYHVGGLSILFRCLLAGATVVLSEPGVPLGEAIAQSGATHVSLVSTQLLRLLREDPNLAGLKTVLMGGGPVPASLVDEAVARGLQVHTSYGLTE